MNNLLVVLSAVLAVSLAQYPYPGGAPAPVQDTPEVAAAKAAHFSLVTQANANRANAPAPGQNTGNYNGQFGYAGIPNTYQGAPQSYNPAPQSYNPAPQSYNPAPAYQPQNSYSGAPQYGGPTGGYQGPLAGVPRLTSLGVPVDTPEVQAARAAALAAHSGGPPAGYNQGAPSYNQGAPSYNQGGPHYG